MPLTLNPVPSRCIPLGSMLLAIYLPNLRVFVLNTHNSFAPIIWNGSILANLNFSSTLQNFSFGTSLSALYTFGFPDFRVAFALSITKSKAWILIHLLQWQIIFYICFFNME